MKDLPFLNRNVDVGGWENRDGKEETDWEQRREGKLGNEFKINKF